VRVLARYRKAIQQPMTPAVEFQFKKKKKKEKKRKKKKSLLNSRSRLKSLGEVEKN
jgi:hypothetical protein